MQLNEFNTLKFSEVRFVVDNEYTNINYQIPPEFLVSYQLNYNNYNPSVTGSMIIDDGALMNLFVPFVDAEVIISSTDLMDKTLVKRFKVTNVNQLKYNVNNTGYELTIQDTASWQLKNSYLGKSYSSGDMKDVISDFLTHLNITEDYIIEGSLPFNKPLVVPKHINNLQFFEEEIFRMGGSIQGTRSGQKIFSTSDINTKTLSKEKPFVESETNQNYMNLIHDMSVKELTKNNANPLFETYDFDTTIQEFHKDSTFNLDWFESSDNTPVNTVLDTVGLEPVIQRITAHKERVKREALQHSGIDVVVSGYNHRELNTVQAVFLTGNKLDSKVLDKGDIVNSDTYIICAIQDRYISGQLLQKLHLRRPAPSKTINPDELQE